MKNIMSAALALSLLSGATVVAFAQNTDTATKSTKKMKHKKSKKTTSTDTMSAPK